MAHIYTITVEHYIERLPDGSIASDFFEVVTKNDGQYFDIKTFYNDDIPDGSGRDLKDLEPYVEDLKATYNVTTVTHCLIERQY